MDRAEAIKFAEYAQIMAMDKPEVQEFYKMWLMAYGANSISGSVLDWLQEPAGGTDNENL